MSVKPVLAVVGRPNVGKSMLVNRILGRREAVVQDVPGVTRDRVSYDASWGGREFVVVDTGGWISDAKGMAARIAEQAELAIDTADAVLFVVDAVVGITDETGKLVGVITDGDLRRHMSRDLLLETVDAVMSHKPRVIKGSILASAAMELMQAQKVTVLFLVDDTGLPSGILHIHDLLRAGVA